MPDGNTKKILWGVSFSHFPDGKTLPVRLSEVFKSVELPGFMLDALATGRLRSFCRPAERLFIRDLLASGLVREAALRSGAIQEEFKKHFRKLIRLAGEAGVTGITIDFEVERTFIAADYGDRLKKLFQGLYGALYEAGVDLLLPVRVPFPPEATTAANYLDFRRQLLFPGIRFSIDVHPHELAGKPLPVDEVMHWLRFDVAMLRFVYEPETGNRLVRKLITPWIEGLRKYSPAVHATFAPLVSNPESLEHELDFLEGLIGELSAS